MRQVIITSSKDDMFGIGSTELIVILIVALIVLGPKNLAGAARTLGKFMGEFKRVSTEFQRTLNAEAAQEEYRQKTKNLKEEKKPTENGPVPGEASSSMPDLDPDSPLAQALANAKKQAETSEQKKQPIQDGGN